MPGDHRMMPLMDGAAAVILVFLPRVEALTACHDGLLLSDDMSVTGSTDAQSGGPPPPMKPVDGLRPRMYARLRPRAGHLGQTTAIGPIGIVAAMPTSAGASHDHGMDRDARSRPTCGRLTCVAARLVASSPVVGDVNDQAGVGAGTGKREDAERQPGPNTKTDRRLSFE